MITFTDRAIKAVGALLDERGQPGDHLRIFITSGGCSGMEYGMGFGPKETADHEMESGGMVFYVDDKSLKLLDGSEVDFDDGLSGKGFEIKNPNAQSTCGCGKSFA